MPNVSDTDFEILLHNIKQKLGVDFSNYRSACLKRRIDNRLRINSLKNYREYTDFLKYNHVEVEQLLKILTIHLTEFYRDESVWELIEKKIIPLIIKQKSLQHDRSIRVWSAGTASGEEAYSLAILFHKILGEKIQDYSLKIYGTDIDKDSLQKAKIGRYLEKNIHKLPPKIIKRYFDYKDKDYQVKENIRQLVSFKYQDLAKAEFKFPMDLIVCRNVLIYFNRDLQKKILEKFSYILKDNGFLILGKTESIIYQSLSNLEIFNSKERIYRKVSLPRHELSGGSPATEY